MTTSYRATAELRPVIKNIGPCQIEGCSNRATVIVTWSIPNYGTAAGWYCDDHAPEEET